MLIVCSITYFSYAARAAAREELVSAEKTRHERTEHLPRTEIRHNIELWVFVCALIQRSNLIDRQAAIQQGTLGERIECIQAYCTRMCAIPDHRPAPLKSPIFKDEKFGYMRKQLINYRFLCFRAHRTHRWLFLQSSLASDHRRFAILASMTFLCNEKHLLVLVY